MKRAKTSRFEMRATPTQIRRWCAAAKADGRTLSGWLTHVANMAATRAELRADYAAEDELTVTANWPVVHRWPS